MKLSKNERLLIARCEFLSDRTVNEVERLSDREYDLRAKGVGTNHDTAPTSVLSGFSGLLYLWAIHECVEWTRPAVAQMTDHPDMTQQGDWSGVRDSEESKLWAIFEKFVVPQIERGFKE